MEPIIHFSKYGSIALVACILLILVWPKLMAWIEALVSREYTRQVNEVWYRNWTGDYYDRIPAWERTIASLEAFDYPGEMVIEARLMMMAEIRSQKKETSTPKVIYDSTTRSGKKIVKVTEVK
ncbi:MAG: hypothetical protein ABJ387_03585 [Balneola sp.]